MRRTLRRSIVWIVCWLALGFAAPAAAQISKQNTTTHPSAPKYSAAYDKVHDVYLLVAEGPPVRGLFVDRNGTPLGPMFNISLETPVDFPFVAWSTVTFGGTPQDPTFLVTYLAIEGTPVAKYGRLVRYQPGAAPLVSDRTQIVANLVNEWYAADRALAAWNGSDFIVSTRVIPPGQALAQTQLNHFLLNGQLTAPQYIGDGLDYEAGPSLACSSSGTCMATGFAVGYPVGANTAIWARMFDASTLQATTPLFYLDNQSSPVDTPMLTYAAHINKFQAAWYRRNGNRIDFRQTDVNGTMAPLQLNRSFGDGAGEPQLVYNSYTKTSLLLTKGGPAALMAMEIGDDGFPLPSTPIVLTQWDGKVLEYRPGLAASSNEPRWLATYMLSIGGQGAVVESGGSGSGGGGGGGASGDSLLLNGNFSSGTINWLVWASSDTSDMVTTLADGVLKFHKKVPSGGGSNTGFIYQDTNLSVATGTRLYARFDLGNSSNVSKSINVMLHTNFSDAKLCTFDLPANSPLRTYQMRALTSMAWSRLSIVFEAVTQGGTGEDYLLDNVTLQADPVGTNTGTECAAVGAKGPNADTNGDGRSDIVWLHTDGRVLLSLMDGTVSGANPLLLGPATGWSVRQIGDFNGDGKSDIVWQHTDGSAALWLMNGQTAASGGGLLGPGTGWSAVQVADFNGDGRKDILWQHTDGSTALWLMNGVTAVGSAGLLGAGAGWSAVQVGDFNGDGKSDIVWLHTDGRVLLSLMDGTVSSANPLLLGPATGWSVRQVGDFNGDGKSDIVWQHTDGRAALWLMNGQTAASGGGLLGPGTGWSAVQVADFNGDGRSDILWQHADGSTAMWLMNGLTAASGSILSGPGSGWHVAQVGDFNGDGKGDIVWLHTDGGSAVWLMNGAVPTGQGGLLGPASGWSPIP